MKKVSKSFKVKPLEKNVELKAINNLINYSIVRISNKN